MKSTNGSGSAKKHRQGNTSQRSHAKNGCVLVLVALVASGGLVAGLGVAAVHWLI